MVARFCFILENEAQELLRAQGYGVEILKKPVDRHGLPLCILAQREPGETRYIVIHKEISKPGALADVEVRCRKIIGQYRKFMAGTPADPGRRCEFWISTSRSGFHCYEVMQDRIQEIAIPVSCKPGSHLLLMKKPTVMQGGS
jgi:hypothetical protein